jgi:hypothetical protein
VGSGGRHQVRVKHSGRWQPMELEVTVFLE